MARKRQLGAPFLCERSPSPRMADALPPRNETAPNPTPALALVDVFAAATLADFLAETATERRAHARDHA